LAVEPVLVPSARCGCGAVGAINRQEAKTPRGGREPSSVCAHLPLRRECRPWRAWRLGG
jgi:hypothetical protein